MRRSAWITILVCAFICAQTALAAGEPFAVRGLASGKILGVECTAARSISGTVVGVERELGSRSVAIFRVRSDEGRAEWAFDALRLKKSLGAGMAEAFDATIAEGDRIELSVYMCGEGFEPIVDAVAIRRPARPEAR